MSGGLVVRSGRIDETFAQHGVNHLIEHLALHEIGARQRGANGYVALTCTVFHMSGELHEVEAFLRDICRALVPVPTGRLPTERLVLEAERASQTRGSAWTLTHALRYGHCGDALYALPELGLRSLSEGDIISYAAERYTAGSAAIWLAAEPETLDVFLPAGPRVPAPPPVLDGITWPAFYAGGASASVAFPSFVSADIEYGLTIARDRALARLRDEAGRVYSIGTGIEHLGGGAVLAGIGCDAQGSDAGELVTELLRVLDDLAAGGATPEEIERLRATRRLDREASAPADDLQVYVTQLVEGLPVRTAEEVEIYEAAASPATIGATLAAGTDQRLVMAPPSTAVPRGFHRYGRPPARSRAIRSSTAWTARAS